MANTPEPFLGEVRMFAGTSAPQGWALCDGTLLPISDYDALYTLIGTTFGGDGQSTFGVPDMRGRIPIGQGTSGGQSYLLGDAGGTETVTLIPAQLPVHTHQFTASTEKGSVDTPVGNLPANSTTISIYRNGNGIVPLNAAMSTQAGGSQPHNNLQPFLCVTFIIALAGIFPPQG